jgi:hypothetical protein
VFLGYEIVDHHIIGYCGQKDARGRGYYFPFNGGDVDSLMPVTFVVSGISSIFQQGTYQLLGYPQNAAFFDSIEGQAITIGFAATGLMTLPNPVVQSWMDEYNSSVPYELQLFTMDAYAGWSASLTSAKYYSQVAPYINHRVTVFDPAHLAYPNPIGAR